MSNDTSNNTNSNINNNADNSTTKLENVILLILLTIFSLSCLSYAFDKTCSSHNLGNLGMLYIIECCIYYSIRVRFKKHLTVIEVVIFIFLISLLFFNIESFLLLIIVTIIFSILGNFMFFCAKKGCFAPDSEKLHNIYPDLPFACIIFLDEKIIYSNDIFKNLISFELDCDILKILPQYELKSSYQIIKIKDNTFQVYTKPVNYKNYENCYISYFVLVEIS